MNGAAAPAALLEAAPSGAGTTARTTASTGDDLDEATADTDSPLAPWRAELERRKAGGDATRTTNGTLLAVAPAPTATETNERGPTTDVDAAAAGRSETSAWVEGWGSGSAEDDGQEDERSAEAGPAPGGEQDTGAEPSVATVGEGTPAVVAGGEKTGRSRGSKEERAAERSRRRQQAIEEGGEEGEDKNTSLMPLVRHLNTVTKELALAYRAVGQVTAERDTLRRQVYELQGLPVPEEEASVARSNRGTRQEARTEVKLARVEARGEARGETRGETRGEGRGRTQEDEPSLSPEEVAEKLRQTVQRRRAIAVGVLAILSVVYLVLDRSGFDWGTFSRTSFTSIAYVGPIFQIMLIGFVVFRMVRVGGKAGRWLFPGEEQPRKRRRR